MKMPLYLLLIFMDEFIQSWARTLTGALVLKHASGANCPSIAASTETCQMASTDVNFFLFWHPD